MPQRTIDLWDTPFLIPPRTRGDGEFKGHGPRIRISTRLYVSDQQKIKARVWMHFEETQSDSTTSSGIYTLDVYDGSLDNVRRINGIVSPRSSTYLDYEQETGHDPFTRPGEGPVREYHIVGNTRGDEAGTRTKVLIHFNPIRIRE
jgi:hypothetical protein